MSRFIAFLFKPSVVDGIISNFLWWFIAAVVSVAYLNATNRLYPLLYKFLGQRSANILRYLISFLIHPLFRVSILLFLLVHINIQQSDLLLSFGVFIVALSFFWQPKKKLVFDPIPQFSDDFSNNQTLIENDLGKPVPEVLTLMVF